MGEAWYRARGIDIVDVDRGGKVTYHGPGQLVGYPIVAIDDVMEYVAQIERAIAAALADEGIAARGRSHEGIAWTGVWVEDRKLASIGLHVSQGVAKHGFAVNVDNSLEPFGWIVPCGLPGRGDDVGRRRGAGAGPVPALLPQADGVALRRGARRAPAADVARAARGGARGRRGAGRGLSGARLSPSTTARAGAPGTRASPASRGRRGSGGAGAATRSRWYGEDSDSLWPITFADLDPVAAAQPPVSRSEARSWRGLPSTSASRKPTCSMPIAVQFSPTVCRHMIDSGTNCTIVPSRPDDEVRAHAGQLVELGVGPSGANVLHVAGDRARDRDVLDDDLRVAQAERVEPVVAPRVRGALALAYRPERDRALDDRRAHASTPGGGTASANAARRASMARSQPL